MTLRDVDDAAPDDVELDPDVQAAEAALAAKKAAAAKGKKRTIPETPAMDDPHAAAGAAARAAAEQANKINDAQIAAEEEQQRNAALAEAEKAAEAAKLKAQLVPDDLAAKAIKAALQHPVVVSLTSQPDILLMSDGRQGIVLDSEGHPNALNQYFAADTLYLAVRIVHDPRVPDANGVISEPLPVSFSRG